MEVKAIALFGEAERGEFKKGYLCDQLEQLPDLFGNPPEESKGLFFATQSLLYHHPLIFFRVKEEGFSTEDYLSGIRILSESDLIADVGAICSPGVGDPALLEALTSLCKTYRQLLIMSESDWLDYLLSEKSA